VATFISPRWAKFISSSGSLCGGRVLWCILSRLPGGDVGFINLYASHTAQSRKILWETMSRELPSTCRWVLLGDFNMVERRSDKTSASGSSISTHERLLFNGLKDSLQVVEYPLTSPSLAFSWDNARHDADRIMAGLDRCYVFPDTPLAHRQILEYRIKGDHSRSGHNLVSLIIELAKPPSRPNRWAMASQHFDKADSIIRATWLASPPTASFFTKLKRVTRTYQQFCIDRAIRRREAESTLCSELESCTGILQQDPTSTEL